MIPPKRITDPSFRYVNAANTDIARTFARIRREMREAKPAANVATIYARAEKVRGQT